LSGPLLAGNGLYPPVQIRRAHDVDDFRSGRGSLDAWLKRRALAAEGYSARTYVCLDPAGAVRGYYALSACSISRSSAPGRPRRNVPDPLSAILLGRLAVDQAFQGRGVGRLLLFEAIRRTLAASEMIGCRALVVHALDAEAAAFYARYGFLAVLNEPHTLFLPVQSLKLA